MVLQAGWIVTAAFWVFLLVVCIVVYLPLLFEVGPRIRPKGF